MGEERARHVDHGQAQGPGGAECTIPHPRLERAHRRAREMAPALPASQVDEAEAPAPGRDGRLSLHQDPREERVLLLGRREGFRIGERQSQPGAHRAQAEHVGERQRWAREALVCRMDLGPVVGLQRAVDFRLPGGQALAKPAVQVAAHDRVCQLLAQVAQIVAAEVAPQHPGGPQLGQELAHLGQHQQRSAAGHAQVQRRRVTLAQASHHVELGRHAAPGREGVADRHQVEGRAPKAGRVVEAVLVRLVRHEGLVRLLAIHGQAVGDPRQRDQLAPAGQQRARSSLLPRPDEPHRLHPAVGPARAQRADQRDLLLEPGRQARVRQRESHLDHQDGRQAGGHGQRETETRLGPQPARGQQPEGDARAREGQQAHLGRRRSLAHTPAHRGVEAESAPGQQRGKTGCGDKYERRDPGRPHLARVSYGRLS